MDACIITFPPWFDCECGGWLALGSRTCLSGGRSQRRVCARGPAPSAERGMIAPSHFSHPPTTHPSHLTHHIASHLVSFQHKETDTPGHILVLLPSRTETHYFLGKAPHLKQQLHLPDQGVAGETRAKLIPAAANTVARARSRDFRSHFPHPILQSLFVQQRSPSRWSSIVSVSRRNHSFLASLPPLLQRQTQSRRPPGTGILADVDLFRGLAQQPRRLQGHSVQEKPGKGHQGNHPLWQLG